MCIELPKLQSIFVTGRTADDDPAGGQTVSNLDEESRWTVHYTAPWHQQENVFLPSTRPPCVEDLHRQAKLNLKSVLRECDKLRQDGSRSSQYYSQGPTFAAGSSPLCDGYQDEDEEADHECSISSLEEETFSSIRRPKTPSSSDCSNLNTQTNWAKSLPLPTPEEKMRQQAQTVQADVVPINITGENFDRQASLRRSLIYTDTLVRRPKKVKRRKTITGVPDNIQKELASGTGEDDVGGPSVYNPDDYSTLGRLDSHRSAGQHWETRDSSCQTEEVRVVPPSMRRIRAQRGQGIAAQMGHFSGSSGNMSVLSDSAGIVVPSRLSHEAGFHSLPRSAARASVQSSGPRLGALGSAGGLDGTFPYERDDPQVEGDSGHLGGASRTGTLVRPKSQELRPFESRNLTSPACVVSPHATYSTSIIPNAALSSSSEVIAIHTAPSSGPPDSRITSSSSHTRIKSRDHLLSRCAGKDDRLSPSGSWNEGHCTLSQALDAHSSSATTLLTLCDSAVSLNAPANLENGSPGVAYNRRNKLSFPAPDDADGRSESSDCGGRGRGSAGPWEYGAPGDGRASSPQQRAATPGYSSPISNVSSCSWDQTSNKDDAGSLYSGDHDGYYASAHPDSGCEPGDLRHSSNGFGNPRHSVVNVFEGRAPKSQGDRPHYHDRSLSRSISLRKAKKPPLPPSRTDSLRRTPRKGAPAPGPALNRGPRVSPPRVLRLDLGGGGGGSSSQSPCSDAEEPWPPRSRSPSTGSAASSGASATTPTASSLGGAAHSDTSSIRSEGAESWPYCAHGPGAHGDLGGAQGRPGRGGCGAAGAGGSVAAVGSPARRVTSPSSGYSSQSNTPPALTPVPALFKAALPADGRARAKPRVPERKSSLVSSGSLSASSTSLSSSTSADGGGAARTPGSTPPFPPPPFPPLPTSTEAPEGAPRPQSPPFPPPPPHVLLTCPPTPPDPLLLESSVPAAPPPAPPLDPKLLEDARSPFRDSGRAEPPREACRRLPDPEEGRLPPLITREALRTVQLRPVRPSPGPEVAPSCGQGLRRELTPAAPQDRGKPSASPKSRNSTREMQRDSPPACAPGARPTPAGSPGGGRGDAGDPGAGPGTSPSRKPPPIAKKPKLVLMVPPPQRQLPAPGPRGEAGGCAAGASLEGTRSRCSELEGGATGSVSPRTLDTDVPAVQPDAWRATEQEQPEGQEESRVEDGAHGAGSGPAPQDSRPGAPQPDAAGPSSEACDLLQEEEGDEAMTPSRPRTTEDLFAAIHRSKRKVLGRKDSDDDHSQNHSPSPPVTPTGAAPSLASPKQVGSIQRSVRKSSTSSDSFKALLLKKGSRSDASARMSAAEMLRSTDPRFQRSRSEPSPDTPQSPSSCSPGKSRRAQEEWAKNEGLMPRSLSFSGPRYGRSRTPPSAASSRYSVRNRIQSSPMTVISEGEGEAMEPADDRAPWTVGTARGCPLDGLAGDDIFEGSLLCGREPAASLRAPSPSPAGGTATAEGGGPLREES
nr:NHS-like protein 1 isoform X2 [Equus caballus]XP_023506970.1 NHS-like protein 1 isoform X2 [Equus caballus]XP_023506971.1 NHS-like protein 1 isoform X2 [Equus caballus]XP_023506972.1 NHS-like protein 1 isoform X2 [Equus caballus]XP_023506973.1 NHS-like protein 1 isoform X2 [Equus caballus]